jgi:hypothetical protein
MPSKARCAQPRSRICPAFCPLAGSRLVIANWTDFLVQATIGSMSASDAAPLPRLGEVFFDVRGDSRSMRLSWYADTGVAVFSIWQGGRCTGTFRLPIDDLPRMIETLQRGPQRRRRSAPEGRRPERADRQPAGNQPGYYGDGDYSDGDGGYDEVGLPAGADSESSYDDPGHQAGTYREGDYDNAGYELGAPTQAGFPPDGRGPEGYRPDGYATEAYRPDGYEAEGHGPDGYAPDEYRPDQYGAAPASGSRPGRGRRAAGYTDSTGYPDDPGYGSAPAGESSPAGNSRSDVPAEGYWRYPDSYQPDEYPADGYRSDYQSEGYQSDGYETDGYQSDSYRTDGYQTAAYQASPTDHGVDAQSALAGYGEERFVPPYVHAQGGAYPNDNPAAGRSRWQGESGPAYPADRGGVSAEAHRYAPPSRSRPSYSERSEDRLSADTPAGGPYSAGGPVNQESRSYRQSELAAADLPMTGSRVSRRD